MLETVDPSIDLIWNKLNGWLSELIKMLPNLVVAAIIMVIGLFIAKRIKKFLKKRTGKYFPTKTLANLTISSIYSILVLIVVFIVLQIIGFSGTIDKALAGAGVLTLGLSFAFQDIAANFISGIFLAFRKPFISDEIIRVQDIEGFVVSINLRDTTVRTYQGQFVTIPNKNVFQNPVTNFTRLGKRRADVRFHVQKMNDLQKVRDVAMNALKDVKGIIIENTKVLFREANQDDLVLIAELWLNSGNFDDYRIFINDGIIALNKAFAENGIGVPNDEYWLGANQEFKEMFKK